MEKYYKSLYLTDDWNKIQTAAAGGEHVVPCLPLLSGSGADLSGFLYVLEDADSVEDSYLDLIDARLSGKPLEILRTKRCIVREICESDLPALYEIYADPEITRYMENLYADPEQERAYTRDYIKWHYGLYGFGMWIITDLSGELIGRAGFEQKEEEGVPELGFLIRKNRQRQGLAYEVCAALLAMAKERFDWKGVSSRCHRENAASVALLQKLGFSECGRVENEVLWFLKF